MKFSLLLCSVFLMACSSQDSDKYFNQTTEIPAAAPLESKSDAPPLSSLFIEDIAHERVAGWKLVYSDEARSSYIHSAYIEKEDAIQNVLMVNVYHEQSPFIIQSIYELDCSTQNRLKIAQMKWDYASKPTRSTPLRSKEAEWEVFPEFSMGASVWSDVCQHPKQLAFGRVSPRSSLTFGVSATQAPERIATILKEQSP